MPLHVRCLFVAASRHVSAPDISNICLCLPYGRNNLGGGVHCKQGHREAAGAPSLSLERALWCRKHWKVFEHALSLLDHALQCIGKMLLIVEMHSDTRR